MPTSVKNNHHKKKQFQNKVLKFFFVLGRYMVFRISMRFARLFESISGRNGPDKFDLSNVERGPRSNFWDHSQHFRTNGFRVIAPNMANFRVKCCFWGDLFTLSCPHLKILTFDLSNVERGPRSNFWDHSQHFWTNGFRVIAPNRANFRVKCCFRDDIFTLTCPHFKTK